jgi:NAD(P)-dependent dehydrogenase (short-subunit alcohol dehydrogenase family)
MNLDGTSAIVTGGSSGLGAATARLLAQHGVGVVIADLQDDKGEALAKEIGGVYAHCDVTSTDQIISAVDTAVGMAPLRSLVCCAGIGSAQRTVGKDGEYSSAFDLNTYKFVLAVNLIGTFDCVRIAATAMGRGDADEDGQRGAIVLTASVAAEDGQIGQAAYSASKGGIVGMTLPVARDLSAIGVRVNTILPGLIDTPIYGEGEASEAFKAALGAQVLFPKRLGRAEEYATLALEMLRNNYFNAESVRLDAGIRMQPR